MKVLCWHGKSDMRSRQCRIQKNQTRVMPLSKGLPAICNSGLHIYNDVIPEMEMGDIMRPGEVVEVGAGNSKLKVGERVIVPLHHLVW